MATTPPNNEAFIREVDEELRRDQMQTIWTRYGRWIVAAVVIGLATLAAWLWWDARNEALAGAEGETLSVGLNDLADGNRAGLEPKLQALTKSRSDGYRASAAMTLAALALDKGDTAGAARQFGAIAADASLAQPLRDLALIRQTATEYDTLSPQTVIDRLKPLALPGGPFFGSAGEMTGIAYMRLNQPRLAGAMFKAVAEDRNAPESLRSRVVQLAGLLGVDADTIGTATDRVR